MMTQNVERGMSVCYTRKHYCDIYFYDIN